METTKTGELNITIDGKLFCVPEQITVKEALAQTSHQNAMVPEKPELSTACHIGACFSCAVEIDGAVKLACNTLVKEKMNINTKLPEEYVPMRKVKFFSGPAGIPQVEAVCFTSAIQK